MKYGKKMDLRRDSGRRRLLAPGVIGTITLVVAGCVGAGSTPPSTPPAPVENAYAGRALEGGGTLFAGIPYAAPPIGSLRWKAPAPPEKREGIFDATEFGAACMQPDLGWNSDDHARQSEDCLTLNVWVPDTSANADLPVMVWFHGGAFVGGAGNSETYDGKALIENGVILVTANYRLGPFGFLAHPQLSAESDLKVSGNYGTLDQIAVLEWVNANIESFGGDPDNVTVFGQSAGAISTASLITSPRARKLFARAIMQSGTPFGIGALHTLEQAEEANADFGDIGALRTLSADELMAEWGKYSAKAPDQRRAAPVIDGVVLPQALDVAFLTGALDDLAVLVGSNVREMGPANDEQVRQAASNLFGPESAEAILGSYEAAADDGLAGDVGMQFMTDMMFRCGSVLTARSSSQSWLYHFFEAIPSRSAPAHSSEVPYVFSTPETLSPGPRTQFSDGEKALARLMASYWTNFAKNGDPNGNGLPYWPAYSKGEAFIELKEEKVSDATRLRTDYCAPFISKWSTAVSGEE